MVQDKINSKSRRFFGFLLDLAFPKYCLACGRLGEWLCDRCSGDELGCELLTVDLGWHGSIDKLYYVADFDRPLIAKIVKTCKYQGVRELAELMGQEIAGAIAAWPRLDRVAILPVSLHKTRLRSRGFNQAAIIAAEITKAVPALRLTDAIERVANARPQAKLSRLERLLNLNKAFRWSGKGFEADYEKVIIVDDVVTTGATMNEIAKILKDHGVKEVWGLAFAHGK